TPCSRVRRSRFGRAIQAWPRPRAAATMTTTERIRSRHWGQEGNGHSPRRVPGFLRDVGLTGRSACPVRRFSGRVSATMRTSFFWTFLVCGLLCLPCAAQSKLPPPTDFNVQAAERFAKLALSCVHKEYPNHVSHTLNSDSDVQPPRKLTPAFY